MIAKRIHATGVVQGVGFRPFVFGLATELGLRGWVCNTSAGVDIVIEGEAGPVGRFVESLSGRTPRLARIDEIVSQDAAPSGYARFEIRESERIEGAVQPVSPDVAICSDCERELFDPDDRRYLYPFINCTNCGPRFTIIRDLPYDRPQTTMSGFRLCERCSAEYSDPLDRRFHAQPIACPDCGPAVQLRSVAAPTETLSTIQMRLSAILGVRRLLREGSIVAVKGLGGFHLACDAANPAAVEELRKRKSRIQKPFAVMMADLTTVRRYCVISAVEEALLQGIEKPIVLLRQRPGQGLPTAIAPGMDTVGVMLPYTPLHHILINQEDPRLGAQPVPSVLVMTSGNFSEEPIAIDNQDALVRLAPLADAFLLHDRPIHIRCDDSVLRAGDAPAENAVAPIFFRRSRGYAPYPVQLPFASIPLLAVGGELKNTFCLARDRYAFLSHYIGDMENAEVFESFEEGIAHLRRLFRIQPERVAYDLHPGYYSTRYAKHQVGLQQVGVQHHHAHIAACMAENGLPDQQVIGVAWDGTGFGTDGMIWGSEFLVASYSAFERTQHLEYLPLPGGDTATRNPWRIAVAYAEALGLQIDGMPFLRGVDGQTLEVVRKQVRRRVNAPSTSSMGRLFDAVASLAGIRNEVTYEAQAAMELEALSRSEVGRAHAYPFSLRGEVIGLAELLSAVIADVRSGLTPAHIGARLHLTLADMVVKIASGLRRETGIRQVVMSGGVWQNTLLLGLTRPRLLDAGFTVLVHRQTPPNDGSLALGQAAVANFAAL